MRRRDAIAGGAGLAAGLSAALTGCLGFLGGSDGDDGDDGNGDGGDGGDGRDGGDGGPTTTGESGTTAPTATATSEPTPTPEPTPVPTPPPDATGEARSEVEGLEIDGIEPDVAEDGAYLVRVTVLNVGDGTVDLSNHEFHASVFDAGGTDLTTETLVVAAGTVAPGETDTVNLLPRDEGSGIGPDRVAGYEIAIGCPSGSDGTYCD